MHLDLHTLFWVLDFVFALAVVFSLILYRVEGAFPGARLWILAEALAGIGSIILAGRGRIPFEVLAAGNAALIAAELCYAHAAWSFRRGGGFPFWTYALIPLVGAALLVAGSSSSFNLRNIIVSTTMASLSAWTALVLYRGIDRTFRFAAFITALPFALGAAGDFEQALLSLFGRRIGAGEEIGEGYAIIYLLSIAMASFSLLGFFLLATQRRRYLLERQGARLAKTNEALLEADRVKDLFMSMLAHDLRGPISGAARYARKHLIPEDIDLQSKRQNLILLSNSLERATELLDNLLLWSKSRKDEFPLVPEDFDLAGELRGTIGLFLPAFEAKGIHLREAFEDVRLRVEKESVAIIARNMISNALKFSPEGGEVEIATCALSSGDVELSVADRGVGIALELRSRLFRIDRRVTFPGTRGEGGSGLGLILCRDYATRIGGSFDIDERPGGGTIARLRIPRDSAMGARDPATR